MKEITIRMEDNLANELIERVKESREGGAEGVLFDFAERVIEKLNSPSSLLLRDSMEDISKALEDSIAERNFIPEVTANEVVNSVESPTVVDNGELTKEDAPVIDADDKPKVLPSDATEVSGETDKEPPIEIDKP